MVPLLALLAFAPGVYNGYVHWDDIIYIRDNPLLAQPDGLWRIWSTRESPQYYPLTFSSYWLEYQVWGPWPTGYFITNLLLHATNSVLVFLVLRALGAGRGLAWMVAAVFALHPVQVASVAWLAERKNVLCGLFFCLTILAYLRYCRRGEAALYVVSLLTFACALFSKTAAVTLPVSLLLIEWLILKRRGWRPVLRVVPMLLIGAALAYVTIATERVIAPDILRATPQPLAAAAAVWAHVWHVLWPARLLPLYPQWQASARLFVWWLPLAGLLAALIAVVRWRRTLGALPVWGLGHFLVSLLPSLGLVPFAYVLIAPVGDHFAYLALPGLLLALFGWVGQLVARWPKEPRLVVVPAASAVVLLALGWKTANQVPIWHDNLRLWSYTVQYNPDNALAYNNLGNAWSGRGQLDEALRCFRAAARIYPRFWMARTNVGIALRDLGRLEEAVAEFRGIVADAPQNAAAHYNLANTLAQQGQRSAAYAEFAEAVRLDPQNIEAWVNWGAVLMEDGQPDEAALRFEKALALSPRNGMIHLQLGLALAAQGQLDAALAQYQEALRWQPDSARIFVNLGLLLVARGQPADALRALEVAARLDPNDAPARLNLGVLQAQAGRLPEAEANYRAARQLDPNDATASNNLGVLLVREGRLAEGAALLTDVVRLKPDHANAHYALGVALAGLGRQAEAIAHFEHAVALQPDDAEAWEQLAAAYAATGRPGDALASAQKARDLAQTTGNKAFLQHIETRIAEYRTLVPTSVPTSTSPTGPNPEP